MSTEALVTVLLVLFGGVLGLLQYSRVSLERWCKEMFVLNSDFTCLQERVRSIDDDVKEIKETTRKIHAKLFEKS